MVPAKMAHDSAVEIVPLRVHAIDTYGGSIMDMEVALSESLSDVCESCNLPIGPGIHRNCKHILVAVFYWKISRSLELGETTHLHTQ